MNFVHCIFFLVRPGGLKKKIGGTFFFKDVFSLKQQK